MVIWLIIFQNMNIILKIAAAMFFVVTLISIPAASPSEQYILPPQNYRHWTRLQKVCEQGRTTYGANEFVEKGQVCRWALVPYWPDNIPPKK